jgi:hypothetical protein
MMSSSVCFVVVESSEEDDDACVDCVDVEEEKCRFCRGGCDRHVLGWWFVVAEEKTLKMVVVEDSGAASGRLLVCTFRVARDARDVDIKRRASLAVSRDIVRSLWICGVRWLVIVGVREICVHYPFTAVQLFVIFSKICIKSHLYKQHTSQKRDIYLF